MEFSFNLIEGNWLKSCVEIALAMIVLFKVPILRIRISLFACAVISVIWHSSVPESISAASFSWSFLLLESLRYLSWIIALLYLLMLSRQSKLPNSWAYSLYAAMTVILVLFLYNIDNEALFPSPVLALYLKILLGLFGVVICEQLIRDDHSSRMTKLVALVAFILFAYDIIVFSLLLLSSDLHVSLWEARTVISSVTSLILALSIIFYAGQLQERSRFKLSNSVIIFNTSLTVVGGFLIAIALLASAFDYFEISWLSASKVILYVLAVFLLIALSLSEKIRDSFVVWTSKHFFAHKYDYKKQWIQLDGLLSKQHKNQNCYDISLNALKTIFHCNAGGIWVKGQQFYTSVATQNLNFSGSVPIEPNQSDLIKKLEEEEWIFQAREYANKYDAQYNSYLPEWVPNIEGIWIILPLNSASGLIGFAVLCKNNLNEKEKLTWEDLDLLKLTGRQIASYISQEQVSEKLIQNQQFDMFNKISAFAIHDIKNLIAQQGLVVKNAEKYKHHPEFIDDVIATIANSVNKMDQLLKKIKGEVESKTINLHELLKQAVKMNVNGLPSPVFTSDCDSAFINGDSDKLLMAINHLIKNAQDATAADGSLTLHLRSHDNQIWIDITDTGIGMDQAFVKNELFQPFNSTKENEGMGIGAFQIREIIHGLNGELIVESTPRKGSKFSIYLPMLS
ncbi:XrtA/PEP-CTERM system histidine kinase PrsK [Psychromonas arctica]|uniref:XrtA/PEP-CTERM system histidine kinase PrsK n=1 Tax=Psychromonas arctica TaxID=168275 RepID=UPI002FD047EF